MAMTGATLGAALLFYGCGDRSDPLAPRAGPPQLELRGRNTPKQAAAVLRRRVPLASELAASAVIGPDGGSIAIPEAGARVTFPAGAVTAPVTVTMTALDGDLVAYTFAPHGLEFAVPVTIEQELRGTVVGKVRRLRQQLHGGYFADGPADLNLATGEALVSEVLPVSLDVPRDRVRFGVWHFSGYLLASGKADPPKPPAP